MVFKISNGKDRTRLRLILAAGGLAIGIAGMAQISQYQEALAGFNTPSFNPTQSISNGIPEPMGDTFAIDQQEFEKNNATADGLGPVYNATSCVNCHQNPNASGGASQITELRIGHNENGVFVNPMITVEGGTVVARSILNDRAICPQAQEHVPDTENIRTRRAVLNTLGDGYVEAIDDNTLMSIATLQDQSTHHRIHGEAIPVPVFEAPNGQTRIGRFGWKDQHGSVLSFAADAYLNEMGITSRLRPHDATTVCKTTSDPEDQPDSNGMADIDHFAQFIRGTMVPPPDSPMNQTAAAIHGEQVFRAIGCATCHVETIQTAAPGKTFAGSFTVPEALGNKIIHPFGDFLLHDVGTGDGIVQTTGLQETADKMRTAPLWGLRTKTRFMHDLKSLSLEGAIRRHRGEAREESERFRFLSQDDRQDLITFLNTL